MAQVRYLRTSCLSNILASPQVLINCHLDKKLMLIVTFLGGLLSLLVQKPKNRQTLPSAHGSALAWPLWLLMNPPLKRHCCAEDLSPANGKGHQLTGTRCWLPAPFNLHGSIYHSPFYIQETFLHLQRIIYAQSHTFLTWVSKRWDSLPKANSRGRLNDAGCVLEAAPRQRIRATTQGTLQLVVPKVPVLSCLKLTDLQASSPELQQAFGWP